jgi:hypothetical protein
MRTSYRDIFLLACCQALLLTNGSGLITMNGLVGYALTDTKQLATLGVTLYVLGSAVATMPASLLMARIGRRGLHGRRASTSRDARRRASAAAASSPGHGGDRCVQRHRAQYAAAAEVAALRQGEGDRCSPAEWWGFLGPARVAPGRRPSRRRS